MISFTTILLILLIHWVADFVLQTHEQAINKSTNNRALLDHTMVYTTCWLVPAHAYCVQNLPSNQEWYFVLFLLVTFVAHTITDYFTSRLCKKYFSKQDYHNGFVVVGFDQILHYLQLFLTYIWLS
jgi:hypothetical protein